MQLKKLNIPYCLLEFVLCLFAVAIVFSNTLMTIADILLAVVAIIFIVSKPKQNIENKTNRLKFTFSFFLIYIALLVGLFYTTNYDYGIKIIKVQLPLLIFPISFLFLPHLNNKTIIKVIIVHSISILIASFISIYYTLFSELSFRDVFPFISHIRLSLNVCFSITIWLIFIIKNLSRKFKAKYTIGIIAYIIWSIIFLMLLKSLTGFVIMFFVITIIVFSPFIHRSIRPVFSKIYRILYICAISVCIIFLSISLKRYYGNNLNQFFNFNKQTSSNYNYIDKKEIDKDKDNNNEKNNFNEIDNNCNNKANNHSFINKTTNNNYEEYTINGNKYTYNLNAGIIEEGTNYMYKVCEVELEKEWNKISNIKYDSSSENGSLKETLIRYLNSLHYPKDSVGVNLLNKEQIEEIESGIANANYNKFGLYSRISSILFSYELYKKTGNPSNSTVFQRIYYWKAGLNVWKDNLIFGAGTGDIIYELNDVYDNKFPVLKKELRASTHNQYIFYLAQLGIFGLLIFIYGFFISPKFINGYKNVYFKYIVIIIGISMLSEDTLGTQAGVTFSMFFYFLFAYHNNTPLSLNHSNNTDNTVNPEKQQ